MDILLLVQAVIMGIVEGITEFLPISSTGYLILSADVLGFWTKEKVDLFVVVVQLGAILAVIYDYWGRLWQALMGLITGKADGMNNPRQLGLSLIVATIPVMIVGFTFADEIKAYLFNPIVVAIMLIIGGLLIFYVEKRPKTIIAVEAEDVSMKTALMINNQQKLTGPRMPHQSSVIFAESVDAYLFRYDSIIPARSNLKSQSSIDRTRYPLLKTS